MYQVEFILFVYYKYCVLKNQTGYTFLFDCPDAWNSQITVTIVVHLPGCRKITIGDFTNTEGQNYIKIPKIFVLGHQ